MLLLQNISKSFATPVLRGIDLSISAGQIVALLGANGAGKSTLSCIVAGLLSPDAGRMELAGQPYAPKSKRDAEQAGVQIVQQELNLIATLSVAENMFLNRLPHHFGVLNRGELHTRAKSALQTVCMHELNPDTLVGDLGVGQRQLVEIAAALSRQCRVLILDEPTAALTHSETQQLFANLRQLSKTGTAVIYISHRLQEIERIADRSVVMRDGRLIADAPTPTLDRNQLVSLMSGPRATASTSGPALPDVAAKPDGTLARPPVLQIRNLRRLPKLQSVTLDVFPGECLGIAGLVGAGRTELLRTVFGADPATDGSVHMSGSPQFRRFTHPRQAVQAGLGLVTEDRHVDGLMLPLSVRTNLAIGLMDRLARGRRRPLLSRTVSHDAEISLANHSMNWLQISADHGEQPVAALSGGNQQKVVLGKWLPRQPKVLLLDEPTRGIDVASRERIYDALLSLKQAGTALVLVSSENEELLQLCDRIAVMSAGTIVNIFERGRVDAEQLLQACFPGNHRTQR